MPSDELRLTYLGWQGWCVETASTRILIDPLLVDEVGRGPAGCRTDFMFSIPRHFHFEALGAVDAVYLSHEHEDHFNVPTLARLDRGIPLLVSGLMSHAGRTLLDEMGFAVDSVWSRDVRAVGDLELRFFGPDHTRSHAFTDEWDTTGFLVRDQGGHGAFASNVDVPLGPEMHQALEAERSRSVQSVLFTAMMVEAWHGGSPNEVPPEDLHRPPRPASRDPDVDLRDLTESRAFRPYPGEVIVLRSGAVETIQSRSPFLEALPGYRTVLPFRNADDELKEPVVGARAFDPVLKGDLEAELRRLAEHLYGGPLFRLLMSLDNEASGPRRTFVIGFVVDAEGDEWFYEYRPRACDFVAVEVTSDDVGDYLGAMLLWATDFWAVACGEIEPRVLARSMVEARADDRLPPLMWILWAFYHPLRFPGRVLKQYRKVLALESGAAICVHSRKHPARQPSPPAVAP